MENTENISNNKLFQINTTLETETGKFHYITWKGYFPRYLKALSKQVIALGWFQKGHYALIPTESGTVVRVSEIILKDLYEVLQYIEMKYRN